MRIALVHNPTAGDRDFSGDDIRRLAEAEGHRVEVFGKEKDDVERALATAPDLLAIAGGDGTVGRAAITSFRAGSRIPLFILPVGTANNIARSLGVDRPAAALLRAIPAAQPTRLDVGRIAGSWGERLFIEAAGVGFIGTMLRRPLSPLARLASSVLGMITRRGIDERIARGLARMVREHPTGRVHLRADGEDLSGSCIAAEVMCIRLIGPNICLSPNAEADGRLDLALVRESDREALADRIERRVTETDPPPLTARRAREVELWWDSRWGHVDDDVWPDGDVTGLATVTIAGSLAVLRPGSDALG